MTCTDIEITNDLLTDIKAKAEKATPGPWKCIHSYDKEMYAIYSDANAGELHKFGTSAIVTSGRSGTNGIENKQNAEYIAVANPFVVLALIEEIEKYRNKEKAFREVIAQWESEVDEFRF